MFKSFCLKRNQLEKFEIENWFSRQPQGEKVRLIFLFLRLAIKKIKGHIPDSTIVSLSLFQFSLVLFLYFSPSINHVGPIIVFASGICFLAACIFPTVSPLHHTTPPQSTPDWPISILYLYLYFISCWILFCCSSTPQHHLNQQPTDPFQYCICYCIHFCAACIFSSSPLYHTRPPQSTTDWPVRCMCL